MRKESCASQQPYDANLIPMICELPRELRRWYLCAIIGYLIPIGNQIGIAKLVIIFLNDFQRILFGTQRDVIEWPIWFQIGTIIFVPIWYQIGNTFAVPICNPIGNPLCNTSTQHHFPDNRQSLAALQGNLWYYSDSVQQHVETRRHIHCHSRWSFWTVTARG